MRIVTGIPVVLALVALGLVARAPITAIAPHALAMLPPQQGRDQTADREELLRLHRSDREAHLRTDVVRLQDHSPDVMISVSNAEVRRVARTDQRAFFLTYFKDARYEAWDDLEEPIIRISDDASMAWMIVRLRVRRFQKDASGVEQDQSFRYAGITTYQKVSGRWMKVANVSSFLAG